MSCKPKTLESAAPLDSSVAVSHIQRLIPKGKWFPPYDESPELQSSCETFSVVMVVSDGLRSTLISSKFIYLYRSMPPDLPRTLCIIRSRKKFGALRAPHGRTNTTLYLCPAPPPPPPSSTSGSAPEDYHALSSSSQTMVIKMPTECYN